MDGMTIRDVQENALLDDAVQIKGGHQVRVDRARDALLTDFGRATLNDRYLMPGEGYQDLFARVASFYGDDTGHAPAAVRLHQQAMADAGDPCAVQWRDQARPADQLLSQ